MSVNILQENFPVFFASKSKKIELNNYKSGEKAMAKGNTDNKMKGILEKII